MLSTRLILTDSGGIQEEEAFLKIPILTLRKNTERPITVEKGTNTIIGKDFEKAEEYINDILSNKYKKGQEIEKWDEQTSKRIVNLLKEKILN